MEEKVKAPKKSIFSSLGKWSYAFVAMAALLIAAIVVIVVLAIGPKAPDSPDVPGTPSFSEGEETGIYYYDTVLGEYTLTLNSGSRFSIAGPDFNKSGDYTVDANTVTLDFVRDEDGTAQATLSGNTLSLIYKETTMNFLKKVPYTVTFNTDGGSTVDAITVINGKTVAKPNDPTKEGSIFLGWYSDAELTKAFLFGMTPVSGDVTVYAKWAATVAGQDEYVIDFDLGYEAAPLANISTIGGKIAFDADYTEPTREGYTFVGWFVSDYEDSSKLTYEATEGTKLTANTTLFAVWAENTTDTLATPAVSISGNTINWKAVDGATAYQVTVTDGEGNVLFDQSVGTTTQSYDFAAAQPGDYEIKVVAKGTNAADSAPAVRYLSNKALTRVSKFEVLDGKILVFNAVDGAEKYYITVSCGNSEHTHTMLDNGKSTNFSFANCSMQEGGITFVVTAKAKGYADSVSEIFVYTKSLDKIGEVLYDEATATFSWGAVANAAKYYVTIKVGEDTYTVDNGTKTSLCVKNLTGEITVSVVPASEGYNSPEATTATVTKDTPAAPVNVTVNNMLLKWDAVEGVTDYIVKINGTSYNVTGANEYDLRSTGISFLSGEKYVVTVSAVGKTEMSLESDEVEVSYLTMGTLSYYDKTLSWDPVAGATKYEVKLNDEPSIIVEGSTSMNLILTKEGVNTVSVRTADFANAQWATIEVVAYKVVYESRSTNGSVTEYVAKGDTLALPEDFIYDGFNFSGWYNTPGAATGNGAQYVGSVFNGNGAMTLYANWSPKKYNIEFVGIDSTMSGATTGNKVDVTYTKDYRLPIMTTTDTVKSNFAGWYTGPGGTGTKLTDNLGNSVAPYGVTDHSYAYPYFTSGLVFELKPDGTYAVRRGGDINSISSVTIPAYFDGIAVTSILENGFYNCDKLIEVRIPDTIQLIGVDAFQSCDALQSVEVYKVETDTPHETVYSSYDGVLIFTDAASANSYVEFCPRAKTGSFEIPAGVTAIRNKAFYYSKLSSITISKDVNLIGSYAFAYARSLTDVVFEEGAMAYVGFAYNAFYGCNSVKTIKLPAHMKGAGENEEFNLATLDYLTGLLTIEVEKTVDANYSSVDGMLCDALGQTLLYCPKSYVTAGGALHIPTGITAIGENVFKNRTLFTEITIPNYVSEIGAQAFAGCENVKKIVFNGDRSRDLIIGSGAFLGCENTIEVLFAGNGTNALDAGKTTIGAGAFVGLKDLRTITVEAGANIALIGDTAFADNAKLRNINVAEGATITEIGAKAFAGCTSISSFTIHATTEKIGNNAFEGCELLSSIIFAPNGAEIEFGTQVFKDCVGLTTVELPATVQRFDGSAFDGCDSLSEVKVDPANAHLTSENGILYNKNKTELMFYPKSIDDADLSELPWNTLTKIGNTVFKNNINITNVVLPNTITEIGMDAFNGCVNLESFKVSEGGASLTVGQYAFANCLKLESVELPASTVSIGEGAFYITAISSFTIPENVTEIGELAFAYSGITEITIPAKVAKIGDGAFAYSSLASVTIADGNVALALGTVDDATGIFRETKLVDVVLPKRVTAVGAYAFNGVATLKTVTIAESSDLTALGTAAFKSSGLTAINLEATKLVSIDASAFEGSKITSITIPNTVEAIKQNAFASASALTKVEFVSGGTEDLVVENAAFKSTKFTEITFPKRLAYSSSVIKLDKANINVKSFFMIFDGNTSLKAVNVEEGGTYYGSKDGVVYEKDARGNLAELLYCPPAKTGELTVPNTVTYVEHSAFNKTKLTKITFEDLAKDHENYGKPILSIGSGIASTTTNTAIAVFGNSSSLKEVNFPSHLKFLATGSFLSISTSAGLNINFSADTPAIEIAPYAIYKNTGLKELHLPKISNMQFLGTSGHYTFASNTNLTTVTFAKGQTFTILPYYAFQSCSKLTAIEIPASVLQVANCAFYGCSKLASVTFEENAKVTEFKNLVFQNCSSLVEFKFPESVTTPGYNMFSGCSKLEKIELSINITSTMIPDTYGNPSSLFVGCSKLKEIVVPKNHPTLVVEDYIVYDITKTILYAYPAGRGAMQEAYTVPSTVREIAPYAFYQYAGTEIILNEGLQSIGSYAFGYSKIKSLHIPASVVSIGNSTFAGSNPGQTSAITTVTFAENSKLKSVGSFAFAYAPNLVELIFPDNVETLGNSMFAYDSKLTTVVLPAALKEIPASLFAYTSKVENLVIQSQITKIGNTGLGYTKIKEIVLPATLTEIGPYAFSNCPNLESVIFEDGCSITDLPERAFAFCSSLKSIVIPPSVTTIGRAVFASCTSIEYIDMSDTQITSFDSTTNTSINGVPQFTGVVEGCTSLKTMLLPETMEYIDKETFKNCSSLESIVIPQSVSYIGNLAFDGCTSLKTVQFAQDAVLTELGNPEEDCFIFRNTTALTSVTLPDSITEMGAYVFQNSGISNIVFSQNLTLIPESAFEGCANLVEVDIPATVETIAGNAFKDCVSLVEAPLKEGLESIGADAFGNCVKLATANIPASVMHLGGNPFSNCSGLVSFELAPDNENFVLGTDGVLYDANVRTVIFYPASIAPGAYNVPSTVYEFAPGAFMGSKIQSIVISDNVKSIPDNCFGDCVLLESVNIPLSVNTIGNGAFKNCVSIKGIAVPSSVIFLGTSAFENCSGMTTFDFGKRNTELTVGDYLLSGCTSLKTIHSLDSIPAFTKYMFAGAGIENFVVPAHITDLSVEGVFMGCANLKTVTFNEEATYTANYLGKNFFREATSLEEITIPDGINMIGQGISYDSHSFYGCTSLKKVTILSTGFKAIGYYAFENCTALETVEFPENTNLSNGIGRCAFRNCVSLKNINMPNNVAYSSSSNQAFENCASLTGVIYLKGTVRFNGAFFKNCTGITELHIDNFSSSGNYVYDEAGKQTGKGSEYSNFYGWTSEQSIYFDTLTYAQINSKNKSYLNQGTSATNNVLLFANCAARVFDKDGNELIYDHVIGYLIEVIDSEGNTIYTP